LSLPAYFLVSKCEGMPTAITLHTCFLMCYAVQVVNLVWFRLHYLYECLSRKVGRILHIEPSRIV